MELIHGFYLATILGTFLGFVFPQLAVGKPYIAEVLMVLMFATFLKLSLRKIHEGLKAPRKIIAIMLVEFFVVPLVVAWVLRNVISTPVWAVVVLFFAVPTAISLPFAAIVAEAEPAIAVPLTVASNLVAPIITPLVLVWLTGATATIDAGLIFSTLATIIFLPLFLAEGLKVFVPKLAVELQKQSDRISLVTLTISMGIIVAITAPTLNNLGLLIQGFLALVVATAVAFGVSWGAALTMKLRQDEERTWVLTSFYRNGSLALVLVLTFFPAEFALLPFLFILLHNLALWPLKHLVGEKLIGVPPT